ncbi:TfuA-like protein [Rhizobium sp. IBUN]|uniref:TfuA-like protein n=1 Tax=Rhizobium sp. IBUN TaxID=1042326 RepID=UPI000422CDE0|nr:TfuA-like protein [Rhizobium sp. IBUN]
MRNDVVVFLGPTISAAEASQHLDAHYLPPAGCGDVVRAVVDYAPSTIALIDGAFAQSPAVRHQEILWAMSKGIRLYGAASMGALRAAELAQFGMMGHGLIFRWYRRNVLADDADVTVPMAPPEMGSKGIGEALFDIRMTLKRAEREGLIDRRVRLQLEELSRSLHFMTRSFRKLMLIAEANLRDIDQLAGLKEWVSHRFVNQKRTDAVGLLNYLSTIAPKTAPSPTSRDFTLTEAFAYDMDYYNLSDAILSKGAL